MQLRDFGQLYTSIVTVGSMHYAVELSLARVAFDDDTLAVHCISRAGSALVWQD